MIHLVVDCVVAIYLWILFGSSHCLLRYPIVCCPVAFYPRCLHTRLHCCGCYAVTRYSSYVPLPRVPPLHYCYAVTVAFGLHFTVIFVTYGSAVTFTFTLGSHRCPTGWFTFVAFLTRMLYLPRFALVPAPPLRLTRLVGHTLCLSRLTYVTHTFIALLLTYAFLHLLHFDLHLLLGAHIVTLHYIALLPHCLAL